MRGGHRPGAGRKPGTTKPDARHEQVNFRVTSAQRAIAQDAIGTLAPLQDIYILTYSQ